MSESDDPPYQSPAERLGAEPPREPELEVGDAALEQGVGGSGVSDSEEAVPYGAEAETAVPFDAGAAEPPGHDVPYVVVDEGHFEQLDKKVVVYWLISGLIGWLFLAAFVTAGLVAIYFNWEKGWPWVWPAAAAGSGLLLTWTMISPSLAYARWRFRVDSELLIARYGIFFIEEKAIPISRLQHVDLYRGLLERFFGLTTLIVFTAGTEGAHFRLPGLAVHRARELRDLILAARGDDVI